MADSHSFHRFSYRIGRALRAHGLQGDVVLQLFRPRRGLPGRTKRSKIGEEVLLAFPADDGDLDNETEEVHALVRAKGIGPDRVVVHFKGVDGRTAAERLEGAFVDVDPEGLPALITDEVDGMLGADVVDLEGRAVGQVVDIRDNGAQPLLFIGEEELMIPAVEPIVRELRREEGRRVLVVDPPPGLLELNEP